MTKLCQGKSPGIKEDTSLGSALFVLSCFRMTWELLLREFPPTIRRLATAPC